MRAEKILAEWERYIPPEVPRSDVEIVINSCFEGMIFEGGSHIKISDPIFNKAEFKAAKLSLPDGNVHIPTRKGRWVKKEYIIRILRLIDMKKDCLAKEIKS
ncbi:MAG: hypothetical protein PHE84_12080 [bacterium]|nr:hypothetical protein [bacterium]